MTAKSKPEEPPFTKAEAKALVEEIAGLVLRASMDGYEPTVHLQKLGKWLKEQS